MKAKPSGLTGKKHWYLSLKAMHCLELEGGSLSNPCSGLSIAISKPHMKLDLILLRFAHSNASVLSDVLIFVSLHITLSICVEFLP